MTTNELTEQRNAAICAGYLTAAYVTDTATARCHYCGELLHPFPKPEYWMQYPLAECSVIDGFRFCYQHRKPGCVDAYLGAHAIPPVPEKKRRRARAKDQVAEAYTDRPARIAALIEGLPEEWAELLAAAVASVAATNAVVLAGDRQGAVLASDQYQAIIEKLNGGTHFGSFKGEESAGRLVERHCRAARGIVPMWGQCGDFVLTVDGVRCWIEFGRGFSSRLGAHYSFRAVDLDGTFFSETGYRSYFDEVRFGQTVEVAAVAIVRDFLQKHRRYLTADAQERLAKDVLPSAMMALVPAPRRAPACEDEAEQDPPPPGFALVDVVLTAHQAFVVRKWAAAAAPQVRAAKAAARARREPKAAAAPAAPIEARSEGDDDDGGGDGDEPPAPAAARPASLVLEDAGEPHDPAEFGPRARCRIVSVHHPCFRKDLGKVVVVTRVNIGYESVWAHDDRPVTYRMNARGRRVVQSDPRCIETVYAMANLRIIK